MSTVKWSPHAGAAGHWAGSCGGPTHRCIPGIIPSYLVSRLAVRESGQKLKVLVSKQYTSSCR